MMYDRNNPHDYMNKANAYGFYAQQRRQAEADSDWKQWDSAFASPAAGYVALFIILMAIVAAVHSVVLSDLFFLGFSVSAYVAVFFLVRKFFRAFRGVFRR